MSRAWSWCGCLQLIQIYSTTLQGRSEGGSGKSRGREKRSGKQINTYLEKKTNKRKNSRNLRILCLTSNTRSLTRLLLMWRGLFFFSFLTSLRSRFFFYRISRRTEGCASATESESLQRLAETTENLMLASAQQCCITQGEIKPLPSVALNSHWHCSVSPAIQLLVMCPLRK